MPTHVALLRGINVGGQRKVAMTDLRTVVSSLGHGEVSTYIQSGNVLFATKQTDTAAMAAAMERAIAAALGLQPRVVVVSCEELAAVADANPYPDEPNPRHVHVIFLSKQPGADLEARVVAAQAQAARKGSRDTARLVGRTLFVHTPGGYGRSELAALLAKLLAGRGDGPSGTARNWATVTKLLALCQR